MLKKYIQDIAKHEARKILLSNYREKLVFEVKQKKDLEEENKKLKNKLTNNIYFNMYQNQLDYTETISKEKDKEIEKLKKENKILQKSYDFIYNNELPELESKVTSKERLATELQLMLNKERRKNKDLEEKLSKISNVVSLYNTNDITFMSLMSTIHNIRDILKES